MKTLKRGSSFLLLLALASILFLIVLRGESRIDSREVQDSRLFEKSLSLTIQEMENRDSRPVGVADNNRHSIFGRVILSGTGEGLANVAVALIQTAPTIDTATCETTCSGTTCEGTCSSATCEATCGTTCSGDTCDEPTCSGPTCDDPTCPGQATCYETCQGATCDASTCQSTCDDPTCPGQATCYETCQGATCDASTCQSTCDDPTCPGQATCHNTCSGPTCDQATCSGGDTCDITCSDGYTCTNPITCHPDCRDTIDDPTCEDTCNSHTCYSHTCIGLTCDGITCSVTCSGYTCSAYTCSAYTCSGYICDFRLAPPNPNVSRVESMRAMGLTTTTDEDGYYTFSDIPNSVYIIVPSKTGYEFSPASIEVAVSGSDVTGQDFQAIHIIAITTVAGTGEAGFSGEETQATGASLNAPFDVFVDSEDNSVFSDSHNHRVRQVDGQTGIITTIAGTGNTSFSGDGDEAKGANLDWPTGVCVDSAGNLFIADAEHHRIRRVDGQTGIITTFAGTGVGGFSGDGGQATEARLNSPFGICLDSTGNLFIADRYNHRIRRVDGQTGIITTVAGTGVGGFSGDGWPATEAELTWPFDVFVDPEGNLFFTDYGNHRIRWMDGRKGIINTIAGTGDAGFSGDGGGAAQARLNHPAGIFVDSEGALFFADQDNNRVRRVDGRTGIITTVAGGGNEGLGDGGRATEAKLNCPTGIFVDSGGNLFIVDTKHNRIRCVEGIAAPTILEDIPTGEDTISTAIMSIKTEQTINEGDFFSAEISVDNVTSLAGFRLDIAFDPAVLEAVDIEEGTFLSGDGGTFCLEPNIDNAAGIIADITCARTSEGGADGTGVLVSVRFKAVGIGESLIEPRNVELSDPDGELMPVQLSGATVKVEPYPAWDANKDGVVSISDLVLVGQHIGEDISTPLDPNPDVNNDGRVDILDLILISIHFGESYSTVAPSREKDIVDPQYLPALIRMYNFMVDNPSSDPDFLITKSLLYRLIFSTTVSRTEAFQNYPNPFNPETWIPYQLAEGSEVTVRIYSVTGQLIRHLALGYKASGSYMTRDTAAYWDGTTDAGEHISSGVYFYTIQAGDFTATKKMVVAR